MTDILIRQEGVAGRITLNRPDALNALTHEMARAIDAALRGWANDAAVAVVVIDAEGARAFCAGGDVTAMYHAAQAGDAEGPRRFWRDEYRMNARIAEYPKPVVSFLQGFVMGGGVGVGCHARHRIVGESTQVAMPECSIGLVPDVGGSLILARAPGRLGEYLALTAGRMGAADAILAGFADVFVPEAAWDALKAGIIESGNVAAIAAAAVPPPEGRLAALRPEIDAAFAGETLGDIERGLRVQSSDFATGALAAMARNSPLSMGCSVEMSHRLRGAGTIRRALEMEYRFAHRAQADSDFIEGIRALIIDKDRKPRWKHARAGGLKDIDVARMLMPLGAETLKFTEDAA